MTDRSTAIQFCPLDSFLVQILLRLSSISSYQWQILYSHLPYLSIILYFIKSFSTRSISLISVIYFTFTPVGECFSRLTSYSTARESPQGSHAPRLPVPMSVEKSSLGVCPFCGEDVPHGNILIEYEDGLFAECPECEVPVQPQ
jgi:hypothetical protein